MLKRLLHNKMIVAGAVIILIMVFLAVAAPILTPYDYAANSLSEMLNPPSLKHIMGTDAYGKDVWTRLIYGARISIKVSFISVLIALLSGTAIGLLCGYFRGCLDFFVGRLMDIMMSFPPILLSMIIAISFGKTEFNMCLAIGIPVIPNFYRIARSEVLSIRERTFIRASQTMGAGNAYIIFRHVIPNALPQIFITLSSTIGGCIMAESSLGFLGLGIAPPTPSWGAVINEGKDVLFQAPWVACFGGLMITLTTLAFNLLGDGLRDVLDPKLREN
ncbi:MAG: ABC transporter permease [Eubacteriales bacterium]|nr:ABC transporter permease [Eubacteriales bacterium]